MAKEPLDICRTAAICQEGNLQQCVTAALAFAADAFAAPLDPVSFKRRSEKLLKRE